MTRPGWSLGEGSMGPTLAASRAHGLVLGAKALAPRAPWCTQPQLLALSGGPTSTIYLAPWTKSHRYTCRVLSMSTTGQTCAAKVNNAVSAAQQAPEASKSLHTSPMVHCATGVGAEKGLYQAQPT